MRKLRWQLIGLLLGVALLPRRCALTEIARGEVVGGGLHCAHRATTALSWGLCEHRDHPCPLAIPFIARHFSEIFHPRKQGDLPEFPILFALT